MFGEKLPTPLYVRALAVLLWPLVRLYVRFRYPGARRGIRE